MICMDLIRRLYNLLGKNEWDGVRDDNCKHDGDGLDQSLDQLRYSITKDR